METENIPSLTTTPEKKPLCVTSQDNALSVSKLPSHLKPSHNSGPFSISDLVLQDEVIVNLWKAMKITYGQKWTDNFGPIGYNDGRVTETMTYWAQMLSRIPLNRIERAIVKCTQERPSPFPPTLPEFYALCAKEPWE